MKKHPSIIKLRKRLGMTQRQFAAHVGYSKSAIEGFERKQRAGQPLKPRVIAALTGRDKP